MRTKPAGRWRGERIPWVRVRVVYASTSLSALEKLIYSEQRGLSNGRGASYSAGVLGLRLGVERAAVERGRRALAAFGLLQKRDLGRGRVAEWMPTMPELRLPREDGRLLPALHPTEDGRYPAQQCRRLPDDDVQAFAAQLDALIAAKCAQGGHPYAATYEGERRLRVATMATDVVPLPERNLAALTHFA